MEADPENDHLNLANDKTIERNVLRGEKLIYSNKVNKKHKSMLMMLNQERGMLISDQAIYNIKIKSRGIHLILTFFRM